MLYWNDARANRLFCIKYNCNENTFCSYIKISWTNGSMQVFPCSYYDYKAVSCPEDC